MTTINNLLAEVAPRVAKVEAAEVVEVEARADRTEEELGEEAVVDVSSQEHLSTLNIPMHTFSNHCSYIV